ncbi:MAG: 16S rRNA (uracil(1498)-N(3))-methyltransferase [Planctomycetia bacterium 21-64-5]|nr:MAG: 16S rRNA (uracil(1498)-N(3))-methyltransferase [Planctomycetia bacterium 21-64-5]
MSERYFVAEPIHSGQTRLVDEEAHHLAHVMRAHTGDEVVVFDGSGAEWAARVARIGRSEVDLELFERREVDRELHLRLTLAVALPKGDRQRWLVEKAVELGVHRLQPLLTERGVAQPIDKALVRLRRTVIEASKQCGRNRLMEIAPPVDCLDCIAAASEGDAVRAMADPCGTQSVGSFLAGINPSAARALTCLIGPEGGFSKRELDVAQQYGWPLVTLGRRILRVETAAVYLAAVSAELCIRT